jgi:hypothetical protein
MYKPIGKYAPLTHKFGSSPSGRGGFPLRPGERALSLAGAGKDEKEIAK